MMGEHICIKIGLLSAIVSKWVNGDNLHKIHGSAVFFLPFIDKK